MLEVLAEAEEVIVMYFSLLNLKISTIFMNFVQNRSKISSVVLFYHSIMFIACPYGCVTAISGVID